MKKSVHLISFDVPLPANYGGVIDVFYKIKALHALNIQIILHVFHHQKPKKSELLNFCKSVYYYKRNSFILSLLSKKFPFVVKSRGNEKLIKNLNKDSHPILFDGLHTTYILNLSNLNNRKFYLRAHNIEHRFYKGLKKSESNIFKRTFYKIEAKKLERYEEILEKMEGVFSISPIEQDYFKKKYGDKCIYVPAFHDTHIRTNNQKKGDFILYHGNFEVSENVKAALFLIDVYKKSTYSLVIASSHKNKQILRAISKYKNIKFEQLVNENNLVELFGKAHINALPTFQNTGIKLKLLNALYQGRFVITNGCMIDQTGLESLCERASSKTGFLNKTEELYRRDYDETIKEERKRVLKDFDPEESAKKIIQVIFKQQ